MKYETAGDPMSDLKWTRKTTAKIVDALALIDITVSMPTVGKILKNLNFSLKTNVKSIANSLIQQEKPVHLFFLRKSS